MAKPDKPRNGLVVWIAKEATGRPNNQRARIDSVEGEILCVTMLGDDKELAVPASSVCGVELFDAPHASLTLRFKNVHVERTTVFR